ncbi:trp operon leader peptide [Salmonella enterica]|nr:trp operon leader peptide [Salmonella enterica]EAZ0442587.1 trp operon leader peptide [Salmonella enterica]EAZ0477555.1 trp operon leader peptide [Salmonella enterica]EBF4967558.1 trp operon leader peptide [Salmonella enterica]EBQ5306735.1 trp operon leader peptide [Salmonella enterica]
MAATFVLYGWWRTP